MVLGLQSNMPKRSSIIKNIEFSEDLNLSTTPPKWLKTLFTDFSCNNKDEAVPINCKYYDASSKIPSCNQASRTMFHLNIASLGRHKDELVAALSLLNFSFDIIAVSETRIINGIEPIFDISIPGYNQYHTPTESSKGGVIIYVNKNLDVKRRFDLEEKLYKSKELESVFIEVINHRTKNELFSCIYRHPTMSIDEFNNDFFDVIMSKISNENKLTYLLGDFNINLLNTDVDNDVSIFYDTFTGNLFVPHITLPTRITPRSQTLIDNIFSNNPEFEKGISGNFTFNISDHLAQFLVVPSKNLIKCKKHNLYKRDLKKVDNVELVSDIIAINWRNTLETWHGDVNLSFDKFNQSITDLLDKHAPLKKLNKKDLRLEAKPWITPGILKSIKRRDKLLRKYINENDPNIKNELHSQYKTLRNHIILLIRESKKKHFRNYFTENAQDIRKTWIGIKHIINIRTMNKDQPSSILVDQRIETNPTKIAEEFNTYFSTIASKLQPNVHPGAQDFHNYLYNPVEQNFIFEPVDPEEMISIINSLENGKASGPNSIPSEIFKLIKANICHPLTELINMSFATGEYPDKLKVAKVVPVFKNKGDYLQVSNYRPISLLSNINKVFEKLVYSRVYSFLDLHNVIYDLQFGFRAGHSTNHALISLTEKVREALDSSNFACGIFIDLQKAFDTVHHDILLSKLNHYGIRGIANNWFRSYLLNRQQFVSINGFDSSMKTMDYGVPQGSVLGPLLFLIYINDLNNAIKFCITHHFADDTSLLYSNRSLKRIQKYVNLDLKSLCKWLKANKISLNASKTEVIIFRDPHKKSDFELKIKVDGKKIFPSKFVKYLGIYIDCHLSWQEQEKNTSARLSRAKGMLCKIRHFVTQQMLHSIYYGIFSSILTYGSQIWGQYNRIVDKLELIQKKAIRIINFKPSRYSTNPLFKSSRILKLTDYIILQNFLFAHDNINKNLPSSLISSFFVFQSYNRSLRGEKKHQLKKRQTRTVLYGSKSVRSKSIEDWNNINDSLHHLHLHFKSKNTCKNIISNFLLDQY